jgi:glutamyl-tRNA synthetase, bacterial family
MLDKQLADLLFPNVTLTPDNIEKIYPMRGLDNEAKVTRIGPSPTGFIHLGNLYNAIIAERLAHQSNGKFFLRIEDTDNKREVQGAVKIIISALEYFGIYFDEGAVIEGDKGDYGPYRQRQRKNIYQVFAKYLVESGLAYPCFCSESKLSAIREKQMGLKQNIGYYGEWASCRTLSFNEIKQRIESNQSYVLRFRTDYSNHTNISIIDAIRGVLNLPPNALDFVLLKSDGIPTYHFAHVIDDHLMRTTHVIRGEEWLSSLPMHIQLFDAFRWEKPVYCHTATLMKIEGNSKRKLSKRKDPELALSYYQEEGYIPEVMWNYLLTVLNSDYEEWRQKNSEKYHLDFPFTLEKMSNSGALFDLNKMNDVSKEILSHMTADEIFNRLLEWADKWNKGYSIILKENKSRAIGALNIGRNLDKVRKDLVNWKQTCQFMNMYFDETYKMEDEFPASVSIEDRKLFLKKYLENINFHENKDIWFDKVKNITEQMGYATNMKDYKRHPDSYKGSIVDLTNVLRIAITGRTNAPDIWEVSNVIGERCVIERIKSCLI